MGMSSMVSDHSEKPSSTTHVATPEMETQHKHEKLTQAELEREVKIVLEQTDTDECGGEESPIVASVEINPVGCAQRHTRRDSRNSRITRRARRTACQSEHVGNLG